MSVYEIFERTLSSKDNT